MDEKRIAEIKARAEAATPAPWKMVPRAALPFLPTRDHVADVDGHEVQPARDGILGDQTADADFIAHAREDVPFLLEQLERAQRDVAVAADDAEADLKEVLRLKSALAAPEAEAAMYLKSVSNLTEEAERLRKELATAERALESVECDCGGAAIAREMDFAAAKASGEVSQESLDAAFARHFPKETAALLGYVSEEECARRCREVGEALEAEFMKRINEMGIDLDAIIDRVAKGGG